MALDQVDNTKNAGESLHTGLAKYNALITELKAAAFILKSAATNFTAAVLHKDLSGADLHTPKAHKASHTDGSDDVQNATAAQKGLATAAQIAKLDGIEANARDDQTAAEILALFEALSTGKWAQHFTNLLDPYGGMDNWSKGAAAAPDGWASFGAGITVAQQADTVRFGEYSVAVTRAAADVYIRQDYIPAGGIDANTNTYWQGRKVTAGCWVYATVAARAGIRIFDGVGSATSSLHPGDSAWHFLTVTLTLDAAASKLGVDLLLVTDATTAYFDGAILVEGTICPTYMGAVKEVWLTSPITSTSFDGDAFSDAEADIDLSTFGNGCPPKIKAVYVTATARDSGSSGAQTFIMLGTGQVAIAGDATKAALYLELQGVGDDVWRSASGWIPCDANGDIRYDIEATGENTFDLELTIWGYILGE